MFGKGLLLSLSEDTFPNPSHQKPVLFNWKGLNLIIQILDLNEYTLMDLLKSELHHTPPLFKP